MRRTLYIVSGILLLTQIIAATPTHACSCVANIFTAQEVFDRSAVVFQGHITHVFHTSFFLWNRGVTAAVKVERAWKGVTTRYVLLHTGLGGGDCGLTFTKGSSIVVANAQRYIPRGFFTTACDPTVSPSIAVASFGAGNTHLVNNWYVQYLPLWPYVILVIVIVALWIVVRRGILRRRSQKVDNRS